MELSLRQELSYDHDTATWPFGSLYTPRSTGWCGIRIFREVLLNYDEEARALSDAIFDTAMAASCEDDCFCEVHCTDFKDNDNYECEDQCWRMRTHDVESFDNAADFMLAHLVPELALLICAHKNEGPGGEGAKTLEESTDEDGIEFLGCLLIGAFEALKIASFFEIHLSWLGLRALAWDMLAEEGQEILVYPDGMPENAILLLAMASSDEVIAIQG